MIAQAIVAELMVLSGAAIVLIRWVIPAMESIGPAFGGILLIGWLVATICVVTMAHLTIAD